MIGLKLQIIGRLSAKNFANVLYIPYFAAEGNSKMQIFDKTLKNERNNKTDLEIFEKPLIILNQSLKLTSVCEPKRPLKNNKGPFQDLKEASVLRKTNSVQSQNDE